MGMGKGMGKVGKGSSARPLVAALVFSISCSFRYFWRGLQCAMAINVFGLCGGGLHWMEMLADFRRPLFGGSLAPRGPTPR